MPRVPSYREQVRQAPVPGARFDSGASPDAFGAGIARGVSAAAGALFDIGQQEKQDAREQQMLEATQRLNQWETDNLFAEGGAYSRKGKDALDIEGEYLPKFDEFVAELGKGYQDERVQVALQRFTQARRMDVERGLQRHQRGEQNAFYVANTNATIASERERAQLNWNDPGIIAASISTQQAAARVQLRRQGVTEQDPVYGQALKEIASETHSKVVEAMLARNQYGAAQKYLAGSAVEGDDRTRLTALVVDGLERERLERERKAKEHQAEAREGLRDQEADAFAAKSLGLPAVLPTRAAYIAAYGADGAERYAQRQQLFGIYDTVSTAVLLPPDQGRAAIQSYRPTSQIGAADQAATLTAASKLYEEQRKAFEADPAGLLMQRDPSLQRLMAADPEAYATQMRASQQAAGIAVPRILPKAIADDVVGRLTFDPQKPEARTQSLQAIRQQWGKEFPALLREIAPKMDGTARVLVGMTPEAGARLDAAIVSGAADSKVVSSDDKGSIRTALTRELEPFAATLVDNVDFEARYAEHYVAAQTLAHSLRARGESVNEAAKRAAQEVILSQYEFRGRARIPVGLPADAIDDGADLAKVAAIGEGSSLRIAAGAQSDDAQAQKDLKALVRRSGYWITNEDQTGLVLMVPTNRGTSAVYRADGGRYELTWDELQTAAASAPDDVAALTRSGFMK